MKKIKLILNIAFYLIIALASFYLITTIFGGLTMKLFGFQIFNVASDSMEPIIMTNDVVVIKKVDFDDIKEGDIITFYTYINSGKKIVVTHFAGTIVGTDGNRYIKTKPNSSGYDNFFDENGSPTFLYEKDIIGKHILTLPFHIFHYKTTIIIIVLLLLIGVGFFIYAKYFTISFQKIIKFESDKPYFQAMVEYLDKLKDNNIKYFPKKEEIFRCFELTPLNKVKVVILGQDPYHEENQANGLAFSVNKGCPLPKTLINIYKEYNSDLGYDIPTHGDLTKWAENGVLLLNTTLTVSEGKPLSHVNIGWSTFTLEVIKCLNDIKRPIVFILWGNKAIEYESLLNNPKHLVIKSVHPSPLSAFNGFFDSKPFSKTNAFLKENKQKEVDFKII